MEQILIYCSFTYLQTLSEDLEHSKIIYYNYTTRYSIQPDEEQLGLRVILPMSICQNMVQTKPGLDRIYPRRG